MKEISMCKQTVGEKGKKNIKQKPHHLSLSVEQDNADKNRLSDNFASLRPIKRRKKRQHRGRNG